MYRMRLWSVRRARWLKALYGALEWLLLKSDPLLRRIGYDRLDRPFVKLERVTKGLLLDSQNCGQCIVSFTGLSCPMNCPKKMRNGPCGGVRADGGCEINPDMTCVWVLAWEGNKRIASDHHPIQVVQPPVDHRLIGHSAWLREVRLKTPASAMACNNEI
ncbi:MAG: methylenetetrahydrofolate reductase C-terminal domain-containing protein [Gammaproteobacteria bacterium]|nr:methylenetetrahydrofolate reductase C-terminal domain-containing protein [Gammaproteobacteria bacterium]